MSAAVALRDAAAADIRLTVDGGNLVLDVPAGPLPEDVVAALQRHKAGIISLLTIAASPPAALSPFAVLTAALVALACHRPADVEATTWQQAVADGHEFLVQWGEQAAALGWGADDVFRLPPVPPSPHPSFMRLARVDLLGLVWLTHGRPVTALTSTSAVIATSNGGAVTFRRTQRIEGKP